MPNALLIDDEFDIRQIASLALQYEGWLVREASNGREALRMAREQKPDLILVDMMMPEMSGLEFCKRLVEDPATHQIPVLLISAVNEKAKIVQDFWQLPLTKKEFLHKPFDADMLLDTICKMTSGRPAAAPTPRAEPKPASPPAPTPGAQAHRALTIDDDPDIRAILEAALSMHYQVETAENGMIGLQKLDEFAPDFIISDINMPVMNGLETAEGIRRHPQLSHVPIFFLTGETDKNLPRKAFDVGGNLYLRKPIDPMQLLKFIEHFIKETGLEAGGNLKLVQKAKAAAKLAPPPQEAPQPAPAQTQPAPREAPKTPVRVLIVDFNVENHKLLRRLILGQDNQPAALGGGPVEALWTDDPHTAVGNLPRWEPDVILYNPRNPKMDGLAFAQTLKLQKEAGNRELAFIGTRFYKVDQEYSRSKFGRDVIKLDAANEAITRCLESALEAARRNTRPKRMQIGQINTEERERLQEVSKTGARQTRERELFRQRFSDLQAFIDKSFT